MSEQITDKTVFSLLEVLKSIQKMVSTHYVQSYWIKAEMNKLNFYSHSGHCYPELVEKEQGKVIAQIRATLWKDDYLRINETFKNVVKEPLKDGIKILFCAKIGFDPIYGLTLRIIDIDPSYALGDLEKEKAATISVLKKENLFNANKALPIALLPQRIAVISVETSKGYSDFMNILNNNPWGYCYFTLLFPALLQGEKAVESIVNQLTNIKKVVSHFDVVAIVRGGGGDVGLSCYNHENLARAIATFPIPIITGIGHSTNETVSEMISYKNAITPTELADFLLQKFHNYSIPITNAEQSIARNTSQFIDYQKVQLNSLAAQFKSSARSFIGTKTHNIDKHKHTISQQITFKIQQNRAIQQQIKIQISKDVNTFFETHSKQIVASREKLTKYSILPTKYQLVKIQNYEKIIQILNPQNILDRGFSITMHNGKSVKSTEFLEIGSIITTQLANGTIESKTISIVKTDKDEK